MSELERDFSYNYSIGSIFIGIAFISFAFLFLTSYEIGFSLFLISMAMFFLYLGIFNSIYTQVIKSHYNQYKDDSLCDYCGKKVEIIKLNNFGSAKKVLCKKCRINHEILFLVSSETINILFIIIFMIIYSPIPNVNETTSYFILLIIFAVGLPFISLIHIYFDLSPNKKWIFN